MKRLGIALVSVILFGCGITQAQTFQVPADANYPFTLAFVDETDGYTAETEKKAASVTVTYCRVSDSNSVSSYTLTDGLNWFEIGNGTGDYKMLMGKDQFTEPNEVYFVKVVCSGCRTVRLRVETEVPMAWKFSDPLVSGDTMTEEEFNALLLAYWNPSTDPVILTSDYDPAKTAAQASTALTKADVTSWSDAFTNETETAGSPAWYLKRIFSMIGLID